MARRILVVEDSPTQAQRAQLILRKQGFSVGWAPNGRDGLDKVRSEPWDLVVTDLMMPEMNGYELTRAIKAEPETRDIPVVMLTTKGDVTDIINGLGAGADNFITKPYEGAYLIERIEKIFRNGELRSKGALKEDRELARFKDKVAVTSDRRQIFELLLGAVGVVIHCNVMGIFLLSESGDKHSLFMVSLQPLAPRASDDLRDKLLAAANAVADDDFEAGRVNITSIVKEADLPRIESSFESFISVPLINNGEVIGVVITANTRPEVFQADDVKLLYMIGSQSAAALDRIGR